MLRGLVLALLLIEGVAWADPLPDALARGRKAVAESDYVAARPALIAALEGGGRGPEELVEIYRLTGIVAAALGDARAATEAFTRLLALSPKATLPAGTSPKIKRPFDAAARYASGHPALELKLETRARPPTITLVRVSDPLGLVATAHVTFAIDGGAEQTRDVAASERTEIVLPPGRRIDARVAALDGHGNRLIEIGSKAVPVVLIGEAPAAPAVVAKPRPVTVPGQVAAPARSLPLYRRWWPYAAVSVAFGGAAAYFGYAARSDAHELERLDADSLHHSFREALAVEERGRRNATFANVGLIGAGCFAVAAGVMVIVAPRHAEPRVAAVPVPGGGALVLGGTF